MQINVIFSFSMFTQRCFHTFLLMHKAYSFLILQVDYLHQMSAPFWKFYSNVHLNISDYYGTEGF